MKEVERGKRKYRKRQEERRKRKEKKRQGLSTVVVTLIVILVSLVAIGILWVVVRNLIVKGTEQVSSGVGQFLVSIEMQSVYVKSNGDVDVTVKRNVGAGDLTEISFIVSDGTNTKIIQKDTTLKELETATFTISSSEFAGSVGLVKEVSIFPVMGSISGGIADTAEISNLDILRNLGIVAWWKLDGNTSDVMGSNPGTLQGGATFTNGKFGQGGDFDGSNGYIQISNESNFDFITNFTIATWLKADTMGSYNAIFTKFTTSTGWDWILQIGRIRMSVRGTTNIDTGAQALAAWPGSDLVDNNWHHMAAVITNTGIQQYVDGVPLPAVSGNWISPATNDILPSIGYRSGIPNFNGTIDEVMVFNRTLTAAQVTSLYQLNLTSA